MKILGFFLFLILCVSCNNNGKEQSSSFHDSSIVSQKDSTSKANDTLNLEDRVEYVTEFIRFQKLRRSNITSFMNSIKQQFSDSLFTVDYDEHGYKFNSQHNSEILVYINRLDYYYISSNSVFFICINSVGEFHQYHFIDINRHAYYHGVIDGKFEEVGKISAISYHDAFDRFLIRIRYTYLKTDYTSLLFFNKDEANLRRFIWEN